MLDITELLKKKNEIRKAYIDQWNKTLNILKIANPNDFWHETFHSRLIGSLFDPETPEIDAVKKHKWKH